MGSRLGRRVIHFANLPIKLLMPPIPPTSTAAVHRVREFALKTIPSATKFEIKSVLESLYGFDVDEVRTLNMEGKKKRRGGILIAKPDYKKAYVTLRAPLSLGADLFPIKHVREEMERTREKQRRPGKTSVVEEGVGMRHWLDKDGEEEEEEVEVGRDVWDRERRGRVVEEKKKKKKSGRWDHGGGADDRRKFPWSSMRGIPTPTR